MEYTKQQFIADVTAEVKALKKAATEEELSKLNFAALQFYSSKNCIYGQITGSCYSKRATELITLCCPRFFYGGALPYTFYTHSDLERILGNVNGTTAHLDDREYSVFSHFSAIEIYISLTEAKTSNLIAYLHGETEELDLNF